MLIDQRFKTIKKLGDGHYAVTFLASDIETDNFFAIKIFKKP
jgi:serine/threonine protein kinase